MPQKLSFPLFFGQAAHEQVGVGMSGLPWLLVQPEGLGVS